MKFRRIRALVAMLLFSVILAGAVLFPAVEVRAFSSISASISGNILTWGAVGSPGANETFDWFHIVADGLIIYSTASTSGTLNLANHSNFWTSVFVHVTVNVTNVQTGAVRPVTSNVVIWNPQNVHPGNVPTLSISGWHANWAFVNNAQSYEISMRNISTGEVAWDWTHAGLTHLNLGDAAANFPNVLIPGHQVDVQVTAFLTDGSTRQGNTVRWTVPGTLHFPTPSISISNLGILTWAGGGMRHVRLYLNNMAHWESHENVNRVDLNDLDIPGGVQSVRIRFYDPHNPNRVSGQSNAVNFNIHNVRLPNPSITINNAGLLTWTGGSAQNVRVYREGTAFWTSDGRVTSVQLMQINLPAGSSRIRIRFLHDININLNSGQSNQVTFNPANIALAPPDINIDAAGILTWTGGASFRTRVYSGNAAVWTSVGTVSNVNLNNVGLGPGNHQIRIRHLHGTNAQLNSGLSNALSFAMPEVNLATPVISLDASGALNWTPAGAQHIGVYSGGMRAWTSPMAIHLINLNTIELPVGNNRIQVRHLHPTNSALNSALSNEIFFDVAPPLGPPDLLGTPSPWALPYVTEANALGLIPAHLRGGFAQATTRAEFAALAVVLYETVTNRIITERATFSDTNDVNVQKVAGLGVVYGFPDGTFAPDAPLTREQAAAMLSRLALALGRPLEIGPVAFLDTFAIGAWALTPVGQVQAAGIMQGVGNDRFDPGGPYTREQSISTILRLFHVVTGN